MVERTDKYVSPGAASRTSINARDKSWTAQNVDVDAKLAEVAAKDARVSLQMALQAIFGLDHHSGRWLRCYWHEVGHLGRAGSSARGSRRQWYPGEDLFEQRFGGTSEEALGGGSTVRAAAMEIV